MTIVRPLAWLLVFVSVASVTARAEGVRLVLSCDSENPVPAGTLHFNLYDGRTDPHAPIARGYGGSLLLEASAPGEDTARITGLKIESLSGNDVLLLPGSHTREVRLGFYEGRRCADGRVQAGGGFHNSHPNLAKFQTGSFCCDQYAPF